MTIRIPRQRKDCVKRLRNLWPSNDLIMKAVIICDDFGFAAKATAALQRVGYQSGINVQWTIRCWPVNALKDAALAQEALRETLDAHLIVFPARLAQSLPSWVFDWLRRWATGRTIKDAGLAAIRHENTAELAKEAFPELCRFLREHGLSFIGDQGPAKIAVHFHAGPGAALPVTGTNFAGPASASSCRAFGIND